MGSQRVEHDGAQSRTRLERLRAAERFHMVTNSTDMNLGKLPKIVKDREAWHAAVHGITKSQTRLSN